MIVEVQNNCFVGLLFRNLLSSLLFVLKEFSFFNMESTEKLFYFFFKKKQTSLY